MDKSRIRAQAGVQVNALASVDTDARVPGHVAMPWRVYTAPDVRVPHTAQGTSGNSVGATVAAVPGCVLRSTGVKDTLVSSTYVPSTSAAWSTQTNSVRDE